MKHRSLFLCLPAFMLLVGVNHVRADYRQTLIHSGQNLRVENWVLDGSRLALETKAPWSVTKTVLHGGKQENVDLISVNNGALSIVIIPTRGMSIYEVRKGKVRLGWNSPVKEIVHPSYVNLGSRGGLGWLEGFNEWMVRCGLEFAGHPGEDKFVNNVGDEATMDLTLHGKIGNIPASIVEVVIDEAPPHRIRIRGRVDERLFYGPQLELWTEVSTVPGSSGFQISDHVTNRGAGDQEITMIYHANFGPPLLEKGAKLVAPIRKIAPMNEHAGKAAAYRSQDTYAGPTPDFIEEVYCIHPYADAQGNTTVMLRNKKGDLGLSMQYSLEQLPYLTQWKNTAATRAGYVTGIEPGTGFPYNRRVERHYGRIPKLKPNESRRFVIDFEILDSSDDVKDVADAIDAIQGDRKTEKQKEPQADLSLFAD